MLVPGVIFSSDKIDVTIGAGNVPAYWCNGFGFEADGTLCIDSDAPAGVNYVKGFRVSDGGALYGKTATAASDTYEEGIRRTVLGVIVYVAAAPDLFSSGNPLKTTGIIAVV